MSPSRLVVAVQYVFLLFTIAESSSLSFRRSLIFDKGQPRLKRDRLEKNPSPVLSLDVGKVVIDTDGGVDDAEALFLALGEGKLHGTAEIIAITCVHGNTDIDHVVVNVLKVLDTVDRLEIPVFKGASKSIHQTPEGDQYFGVDGFGDVPYPNAPDPEECLQKKHAVQALLDTVDAAPGEVTILALGPLTNIALAIRLDASFLTKVRNIVVMGGSVEGVGNVLPGIEFNFYIDPEAAFIVFNSTDTTVEGIKPIILLPWETVAKRQRIPMAWRRDVLGQVDSPQVRLLNRIDKTMINGTSVLNADPMAAAITFRPDIVEEVASAHIQVQYYGENGGAIFVDYELRRPANTLVVLRVEVDSYKSMLLRDLA